VSNAELLAVGIFFIVVILCILFALGSAINTISPCNPALDPGCLATPEAWATVW